MNSSLPPNQQLAAPGKWPIVGERLPRNSHAPWTVSVSGQVALPRTWGLDELRAMPMVERAVDIHCVTRWSKLGARFGGIELRALLEDCSPLPDARFISFVARSARNHSTSLALAEAIEAGALIALTYEGAPLDEAHGGPVRIVTPGRYFYKSVKWVEQIELLAEDRLGFWEAEAGYHNEADPWREQRYVTASIDRNRLRAALAARDFRGMDLLGIEAAGMNLDGLDARDALLRNARFQNASLSHARFDGANLSNARFTGADLRGASFRDADVEGADFAGADLRNADFGAASLFGSTFVVDEVGATLDQDTRFDWNRLDSLAPEQAEYLLKHRRELSA